jgi:7,8-dihydropterin-6-yl-methyl-4-(beta-D-ribofuranosyl)aminobenzene 5'-phosphate synthase
MSLRISPVWWPGLLLASPVLVPLLAIRDRRFKKDVTRASAENRDSIDSAPGLDLPLIDKLEVLVLSEWRARDGFRGEAGVSYLFRTERGTLLYDVAFGDQSGVVPDNARRLGVEAQDIDAVAISHLHNDHMGGLRAYRAMQLGYPKSLRPSEPIPCFLPAEAAAPGFNAYVVREPRILAAGIASTGPLARRLFFLGWLEEQALIAHLRDKGLVVFSGCGHPTLSTILEMVRKISSEPIYAIGGGLHLPLTGGRVGPPGIDLQTILGTGKPPWRKIREADVDEVIHAIRIASPTKVLLSAHDSCDESLRRIEDALECHVEVLEAGGTYTL